ncbi:thiamine pyrophosphate-binding protein [Methylophilaceae bacterium]|jgi:acetolactate synthase-1/2/3 large subunit|nr:thiamine pyrophosphate-binding protein [Methylophilaceae bacterium]|tara:strand:- start:10408 stop:12264 length:1857 start_codon:yes stop_codon:yes gene_type:complete
MNKKIRVSDYIAQRSVEFGARHVFLVTGGGAMHLNDAFTRHKSLTPVFFHHEQSAAMAAESYYRLTNKVVILNVTTGPGGINALNGVYGAYMDSLSMLVVSGQVKNETYLANYKIKLRQLGDQEVDIVSMAKPITKYAVTVKKPEEIIEIMDKAIFLLLNGRPGPVWVDVPIDIQGALIDPSKLKGFNGDTKKLINDPAVSDNTKLELTTKSNLNDKTFRTIFQQLKKSKRPVILGGTGVSISKMNRQFLQLIKKLKIPVVTGWNAHDLISNDNRYYSGKPGTVGDRPGNFTVQNSDLLIVLGCRLNIRQISYSWKGFAPKAFKIMVDLDQAELDKPTLKIDYKIKADLKKFIPLFLKKIESLNYATTKEHNKYLKWCKEKVIEYPVVLPEYTNKKNKKINPYVFIDNLFDLLNKNDVVITGNGSACVISFQAAKIKQGQRLYTNSGSASMGYDLPASIGAAIALKGKRVICLAGDGSLMMNLQELQTMKGYKLPIKVFVLNNDGYVSIKQTQETYFSDNISGVGPKSGVSMPNFTELGKALNIPSMKITKLSELYSATFKKMFNSNQPGIFEIVIDPSQGFSPKLTSRKLKDGTMVSPSLHDMSPFLDEDELAKNIL